ncbi:MAG: hypothetical protein FJW39_09485 [Acidobacteria bacterium]|nr:hypothetical protein [Acidobacteriota bacterium]
MLDPSEIRGSLERILKSAPFRASRRMQKFLRYAVEESLAGRAETLKESVVGAAVFERDAAYDTRVDGIVRVEARRLRSKLTEYYQGEGASERIRIEFPSGCYAPAFTDSRQADALRTIAVMPFTSVQTESDQEFADGLTQELIYLLTRIPSLRVIAWNSVEKLRGLPNSDAARQLRADSILEGSVRRNASRVRIHVQLSAAATGVIEWNEVFERELTDLFSIQEDLARCIAHSLRVTVNRSAYSPDAEAYQLYVRGRHAWNRRTEAGFRKAVIFFERAVAIDPNFALAHAGLSDCHSLLCDFGFEPPATSIAAARAAAARALELDPTLAEAHCSSAFVFSMSDWDWEQAERSYRRAIELRPSYPTAHHWLGCDLLALQKRWDEAGREMEVAIALDPLEPALIESMNYLFLLSRRYSLAEERYHDLLKERPDYWKSYTGFGRVLTAQGRYGEAAEMLERGRSIAGDTPVILAALAHVRGLQGNSEAASGHVAALRQYARRRHVAWVTHAIAHLGLRDRAGALYCLERAAEARELSLAAIAVHPVYDELRGEPRLQELIARIGLS